MDFRFYDVKNRKFVTVPAAKVMKTKFERTTKTGKMQTRYAIKAEMDGSKLTKFVSQADWDGLDAPMV